MPDTSSTTTFRADISSLRAEMQAASRAVKVANSEFKAATAGMDDWGASADGLEAKIKQLNAVLAAQNKQVDLAAQELSKCEAEYGENSAEADRARIKYNGFKAAAAQTQQQLDSYEKELKNVESETKDVGNATTKAGDGFTVFKGIVANLAGSAIKSALRGLKDLGQYVVQVGSDFEAAMSEVEAISGASGQSLDQMSAKAKELGSTTKFTASEVAQGFKYMALAGWDTADSLEAIDGVINLAAASGMDLGRASDMVTDYLSAFGLEASDASKMVDELVYAQSHSNTSTQQLGDAFGNCAANMNAAGQSMETTVAILEALANQGTKGSEAGTQLAAIMRDITNKMEDGSIMIGDTAVSVQDAEGNFRDLTEIMADVERATRGMGTAERAAALQSTFTARSVKAVNQILQEGTDDIKGYKDALEESNGAAADTADTMLDNFSGSVTKAKSAMEGLGVTLFDAISKPARGVVDTFTELTTALNNFLTPPAKSDLETYLDEVDGKIAETKGQIESLGSIELKANADVSSIETYRSVLEKATKGEELSEFEKYQLKRAVEELGGVIPGLTEAYDEETSSINLTKDALDELLDSTIKQIKMDAYSEAIEEAYKAAADAAMEAAEAQSAYESATKDLSDALDKVPQEVLDTWDLDNMDPTVIYDTATAYGVDAKALMDLISVQQQAKTAVDEANAAQKAAEDAAESRVAAIKKLEEAEDQEGEAAGENAKAHEDANNVTAAELPTGAAFVNMNKEMFKSSEKRTEGEKKVTKAAEEATEATEKEVKGLKFFEDAFEFVADAAEDHKDDVTGFFQAAGDAAMEAIEEKVAKSAQMEKDALNEVRTAYESTYNSIKNTIANKISLWDAFDGGEDVTVEQMIANLQTQTQGIEQMQTEMQEVIAAYGDDLGADLITTLQGMGTDAANTWHHMWITMQQDNAPELFAQMGEEWSKGIDLSDQIAKYAAGNLTAYQLATNELGSTKVEWTGLRESVAEMTPELDSAISAAEAAGVKIPDGLQEGIESGEYSATDAVTMLTNALQGTFEGLYEIAEASGADIPDGLSAGMEGSAEEYQAAINTLTESLSQAGNDAGTAAAEEISTGLSDNTDSVETAAEDTASSAATAADSASADFNKAGASSGTEYIKGLRSKTSMAKSAGTALANSAKNGLGGVSTTQSGVQFAQGYINGINSLIGAVVAKAREMVRSAINAAKAEQQEGSPSKLTYQSGKYFTQGFINGIASEQKKLIKTVQGVVGAAVKELSKVSNYDFGSAGERAMDTVSAIIDKQSEYMMNKMQYNNQLKLDEFEAEITRLENERNSITASLQAASDKKQAAIQKKLDKAKKDKTKKKYKAQLTAEKNAVKGQIASVEAQYEALIKTQENYQKAYSTASSEMMSEFQDAIKQYQKSVEDLIEDTVTSLTDKYDEKYENLIDKQDNLIQKLKEASDLFEVGSSGVMIIGNIQDQTKQIQDYTEKLRQIKQKVSAELFDQIAQYDMKEGAAYTEYLLGLSEDELDAYNTAYTEKLKAANDAAEIIYGDDVKQVAADYQNELLTAFDGLADQLEELGKQAMEGFIDGLGFNTDYMSKEIRTFISGMIDQFKDQLQIHSPSRVMLGIGEYTGEGFIDGILSMIRKAKAAANELASAVSTPLDGISGEIGSFRAAAPMIPGEMGAGGGVVNNYNLVQNNNSPKSLSALETYQARRRQIALVKAFAS